MMLNEMTVLVTGGTGGVGSAIVKILEEHGANIVIHYYQNASKAESLTKESNTTGHLANFQADLTDPEQVESLYQFCLDQFGQLDAIVHCATPPLQLSEVKETDYATILHYMDVYVKAFLILARLSLPSMMERRFGRFISISSIAAQKPISGYAAYAVGKAGLDAVIRNIALEGGPFGVTANSIVASLMETPLTAHFDKKVKFKAAKDSYLLQLAAPDDIAAGVYYLLGESGRFITGITLPIMG